VAEHARAAQRACEHWCDADAATATTADDRAALAALAAVAAGHVSPLAAVLGGVAGQEVIKVVSGRFTPLPGAWWFDAAATLATGAPLSVDAAFLADRVPAGDRYDGQVVVWGRAMQAALASARVFLVGAGALGCEYLKSFACMGVACGGGEVTVTDMDSIETSNLNRQFLFRARHVGALKSAVAAEAARAINPALAVRALATKVAPDTAHVFDDAFWTGLTAVVTALDNVPARLYVDSQCVVHGRPLFESGTLGTKCHTQAVLPGRTLNYGAVRDPPERDIPVCTLKSFPTALEHTLQWARDEFEARFKHAPDEANAYLQRGGRDGYWAFASAQRATLLQRVTQLHGALVRERPRSAADAAAWARARFEELFSHNARQLLHQYPVRAGRRTGGCAARPWAPASRSPSARSWTARTPAARCSGRRRSDRPPRRRLRGRTRCIARSSSRRRGCSGGRTAWRCPRPTTPRRGRRCCQRQRRPCPRSWRRGPPLRRRRRRRRSRRRPRRRRRTWRAPRAACWPRCRRPRRCGRWCRWSSTRTTTS
jgi:ubiquitin-activating enzyme E1